MEFYRKDTEMLQVSAPLGAAQGMVKAFAEGVSSLSLEACKGRAGDPSGELFQIRIPHQVEAVVGPSQTPDGCIPSPVPLNKAPEPLSSQRLPSGSSWPSQPPGPSRPGRPGALTHIDGPASLHGQLPCLWRQAHGERHRQLIPSLTHSFTASLAHSINTVSSQL